MQSSEVRQVFIERPAQSWSSVRIASELGVACSTLIEWSRQLRFQLQNRTAIELDDIQPCYILQETDGVIFATPVRDIPNSEYVEEIQEWKP